MQQKTDSVVWTYKSKQSIARSDSKISLSADSVDGDSLLEERAHIVAGRDTLEVALSKAVLLVAWKAWCGVLNIVDALAEAAGKGADLELGIEAGLVLIQVLLFVFVEEHVLHVEQLAPGAEETITVVIIRRVGHGVLSIADVGTDLLSVLLTAVGGASRIHFSSI